jgi:hypothetical protein
MVERRWLIQIIWIGLALCSGACRHAVANKENLPKLSYFFISSQGIHRHPPIYLMEIV